MLRRANVMCAVLLLAATAVFLIGTTAERSDHHDEAGTEHVEGREGESHAEGDAAASEEWTILGIDRESPVLLTMAVLVSVAAAAAIWARPRRVTVVVVVTVCGLFAIADVTEVAHQLDDARAGLVVLAFVALAGHAAAAGIGLRSARVDR